MAPLPTRRMLLRCALGAAALPFGPAMSAARPPEGARTAAGGEGTPMSGAAKANNAESRIALVIGNGAYRAAPLKNPTGDASAVAGALRGLGYDVTLRQNTRLPELI